jgi:hypothetical protein
LRRKKRGKFQQKGAATALTLLHYAAHGDKDALIRIAGEGHGTDDDGIWGAFEIFYSVLMQNTAIYTAFREEIARMPADCQDAADAARVVIFSQDLTRHNGVNQKCQAMLLIFMTLSMFADDKALGDLVLQLESMDKVSSR